MQSYFILVAMRSLLEKRTSTVAKNAVKSIYTNVEGDMNLKHSKG